MAASHMAALHMVALHMATSNMAALHMAASNMAALHMVALYMAASHIAAPDVYVKFNRYIIYYHTMISQRKKTHKNIVFDLLKWQNLL
jgi:hypothetical protein